jgi:hypothetical protein
MRPFAAAALLFSLLSACVAARHDVASLEFVARGEAVIVVAKFPAGHLSGVQPEHALTLHLLDSAGMELPAILGSYNVSASEVRFTPSLQLEAGQSYRAKLNAAERCLIAEYSVPLPVTSQAPTVAAVFPSAGELPANNLKFYVHFSRSMREQSGIFDQIRLIGENGEEVRDPWRRSEFWSADFSVLTLRIHPGRIKHGVSAREAAGPVLIPGRKYTLEIKAGVVSRDGARLQEPFLKHFTVGEEDCTRPLPENWELRCPATGTREPLTVNFGESLDSVLANACLSVADETGRTVLLERRLLPLERAIELRPLAPWREVEYRLVVENILEDLAGNTPLRLFDARAEAPQPAIPVLVRAFHPAK